MSATRPFPTVEVVIAALAIAILAIAASVNGHGADVASKHYDTFSTYDAASGGYRAWYDLLVDEGVRVERFEKRPAFLDRSVDVYVIASNLYEAAQQARLGQSTGSWTPGDWDAVAKWVRGGGRLVWLTDGHTITEYINAPSVRPAGPSVDAAVAVAPSPLTAGVDSVSGSAKLRVPFGNANGAAPLVADDTGSVVTSYPLGKGSVTVVTDETLFENARLSSADNARLAFDLAATGLAPHTSVAFDEWSHGYVAGDRWWQILPRPFQAALIAIGSTVILLLIGTGLRFGPTARLPNETERTSAEYLSSMAFLYERGRAVKTAIRELADACIRDVAAALGVAENAPARAIAARMQGAGTESDFGEAVMELDRLRSFQYVHPADLIRAAQLSAALRKEFSRHGRISIGRRTPPSRRTA